MPKRGYGHYLPFCAHLELISGFTKQHHKLSMLQFDYAVVFLYVMPSEAEAFCCLENFVARCPAFAESNFPGFFQSLKV